jgi:uncharacterized membrane protein
MDGSGTPAEAESLEDIQNNADEIDASELFADKNNTINPEVVSNTQAPSRIVKRRGSVSFFRGPLPPAEELAKYNQIIPNGADRIMAMAEKEQSHRQNVESIVVNSVSSQNKRGQWFAYSMAILAIFYSAYLINLGRDWFGISVICGDFLVIAGAFIGLRLWPSKGDNQERDNEDK